MTQNHKCLVRYKKPYVTQESSAEYLLNKINMYPMLIPLFWKPQKPQIGGIWTLFG